MCLNLPSPGRGPGNRWRQGGRFGFVIGVTEFSDPAFYGDRWAAIYDHQHGGLDATVTAEFLAGLAGGGGAAGGAVEGGRGGAAGGAVEGGGARQAGGGSRVLELAIGTGRVALPLAAHGIQVEGLDASAAMVERLRAKPGGAAIPVTIGDMAQVPVEGSFRLVYLVFNTLFGLLTQARQAACFRNVARVLDPDGVFVIECFVPDLARFDRGQRVQVVAVTEDSATVQLSVHDSAEQHITMQVVTLDGGGMHLHPIALRYAWPSELDLMAEQAGLRLRERYGDWNRQPFDSGSSRHVSVYQRA
jgi:SAM-dependent methyltransferase